MLYSEYLKNGGQGIIQLLHANGALDFLPVDDIQPLDSCFLLENGSKELSLPVSNLLKVSNDMTTLASMLKVRYGKWWKVLYNSQPVDSDPVYNQMVTSTGQVDTTGKQTNQIAGYDSPTMVDNDGTNTTSNQTNNVTTKTLNYDDLSNLLGELKNNLFYDKLFTDIRNYIFMTVYGNERDDQE